MGFERLEEQSRNSQTEGNSASFQYWNVAIAGCNWVSFGYRGCRTGRLGSIAWVELDGMYEVVCSGH